MFYHNREIRIIELNQKVPAFEFPAENWHGYSTHLSMNPGIYSTLLLRSGILPDMRFFSVAQTKTRGDIANFWLEADKDSLARLGLLEKYEYRPGTLPLPMPPAVLGGSRWSGYYILNPEILDKVSCLKAHLYTPNGEYAAHPNIITIPRTSGEFRYSKGIKFDCFKDIRSHSGKPISIPVPLKDEDYLRGMSIMFTSAHSKSSRITLESAAHLCK